MNCHESAAKYGWKLYGSADPPPSLDEINDGLLAAGLDHVSNRMYRHYRRLASNAYDQYVPINELDITLKLARSAG